jgi:hypothetical protein
VRFVLAAAVTCLVAAGAGPALAERAATGAEDLFRRGVEALEAGRYADAASLFRLSYSMQPRVEAQCNLGVTFERWAGHDREALEAYDRCAAEDDTGQFRQHAIERSAALRLRLVAAGPRPPAVVAPPALAAPPAAAGAPVGVAVVWQDVRRTAGCFYFSGPAGLGRNDALGDLATWSAAGGRATLTFAGGQVFTGVRAGPQVELTRRTTYSSGGAWQVTEIIRGGFRGDVLEATYSYRECEAARPAACPGNCTIEARVVARPR